MTERSRVVISLSAEDADLNEREVNIYSERFGFGAIKRWRGFEKGGQTTVRLHDAEDHTEERFPRIKVIDDWQLEGDEPQLSLFVLEIDGIFDRPELSEVAVHRLIDFCVEDHAQKVKEAGAFYARLNESEYRRRHSDDDLPLIAPY
jgi:hypothetical protein